MIALNTHRDRTIVVSLEVYLDRLHRCCSEMPCNALSRRTLRSENVLFWHGDAQYPNQDEEATGEVGKGIRNEKAAVRLLFHWF